ncbi:hypothetical protein C2E23DRAFT_436934 [Lenzites betulinus]|nr:hypothetical protein C2E23DRAFT_436934 [Lenzites betulinus]
MTRALLRTMILSAVVYQGPSETSLSRLTGAHPSCRLCYRTHQSSRGDPCRILPALNVYALGSTDGKEHHRHSAVHLIYHPPRRSSRIPPPEN